MRARIALATAALATVAALGVPLNYAVASESPVPAAVAEQATRSASFIASQIVADNGVGWGVDPARFGELYAADGTLLCTAGTPFHAKLITSDGWDPAVSVASQAEGDLWGYPILDASGGVVGVALIGVRADGEMTLVESGASEAAALELLWSESEQRALLAAQGISDAADMDLEMYAVDSPWFPYVVLSATDENGTSQAILIRNVPGAQVNVAQKSLSLRTTTVRQVVVGVDPLLDGLMARHEADMASGLLGDASATTPASWTPSTGPAHEVLVTRVGLWDSFVEWLRAIV